MLDLSRRSFLGGLIAAPAVVAYGNLMPVRGIIMPVVPMYGAVIVDEFGNTLGRAGSVLAEVAEAGAMKFSFGDGMIFRSGVAYGVQIEKNGKPWIGMKTKLVCPQRITDGNSFTLGDFGINLR